MWVLHSGSQRANRRKILLAISVLQNAKAYSPLSCLCTSTAVLGYVGLKSHPFFSTLNLSIILYLFTTFRSPPRIQCGQLQRWTRQFKPQSADYVRWLSDWSRWSFDISSGRVHNTNRQTTQNIQLCRVRIILSMIMLYIPYMIVIINPRRSIILSAIVLCVMSTYTTQQQRDCLHIITIPVVVVVVVVAAIICIMYNVHVFYV